MPTFPPPGDAPRSVRQNVQIGYIDAGGDRGSSTLNDVPATVVATEIVDLRNALGGITNAAVISDSNSAVTSINVKDAIAFDEAFSTVGSRVVFVFQDDDGVIRSVSVPAPDLSIFESDRVTPDPTNSLVIAAVGQIANVLNGGLAGSGTFEYVRGYRQTVSRTHRRAKDMPDVEEPGELDNPPPAPGE